MGSEYGQLVLEDSSASYPSSTLSGVVCLVGGCSFTLTQPPPASQRSADPHAPRFAELSDFLRQLSRVNEVIATRATDLATLPTITTPSLVATALSTLPRALPATGFGLQSALSSLSTKRL